MPYKNNWTDHGLYRKFSGIVSGREIFESNTQLHGDERFDDLQYIVNDFTGIEDYDVSDIDINLIANSDKISNLVNRKVKVAIVVDNPEFYEWVDKYFLAIGQAMFDCLMFEDIDAAMAWIEA